MRTNVTLKQLYYNNSLLNYFFRTQAQDTFNELLDRAEDSVEDVLEQLSLHFEDMELDDVEEIFYNDQVQEIADTYGISLMED